MTKRAPHPYAGLWAAVATMHGKERVIAPAFQRYLDIRVTVAPAVDTDLLGTFTGEIARQGTLIDAARAKARLAVETTGAPLGIGSEGAFGGHPSIPYLASGLEALVLHHAVSGHDITLVRRTPTNFDHVVLGASDDPAPFLTGVGFPDHAVIVRPEDERDHTVLFKGIQRRGELEHAIRAVARHSGTGRAMVQTDMRAHLNPTRMAQIARVAKRLALRVARCCPCCGHPGFGQIDVARGLPCRACGIPTERVRAEIHGCQACGHTVERFARPPTVTADEGWCPACNP